MWFDIEIRKFEYEHSYAAVLFCSYFIYAGITPILRAALLYIKKITWGYRGTLPYTPLTLKIQNYISGCNGSGYDQIQFTHV
jgi:hypothetical protein